MRLTTLCYIEKDEKYLMLHRTKKKKDEKPRQVDWMSVGSLKRENHRMSV